MCKILQYRLMSALICHYKSSLVRLTWHSPLMHTSWELAKHFVPSTTAVALSV